MGDQFLMSTPLDNVPAIENQDLVGITHRFQPVGDQDQGFPLCQRGDRGLEFRFVLRVYTGRGLVQNYDGSMARAMEIRCFSPPEREPPPSPKTVS